VSPQTDDEPRPGRCGGSTSRTRNPNRRQEIREAVLGKLKTGGRFTRSELAKAADCDAQNGTLHRVLKDLREEGVVVNLGTRGRHSSWTLAAVGG
jgi:hypothetical protein